MDLPSPPRQLTPEEVQTIKQFREKVDKLSVVEKFEKGIDGTERYTIEDGEVVIHVDKMNLPAAELRGIKHQVSP